MRSISSVVVKNWPRLKNSLEYWGLGKKLNNPNFKEVEFDPLLNEAESNSYELYFVAVLLS
ncbi:MAG: hypothetical protein E7070_01470 [Bacteroidales bacterium]|nr:hypothetical protein [Bacteroidales bacterium]